MNYVALIILRLLLGISKEDIKASDIILKTEEKYFKEEGINSKFSNFAWKQEIITFECKKYGYMLKLWIKWLANESKWWFYYKIVLFGAVKLTRYSIKSLFTMVLKIAFHELCFMVTDFYCRQQLI